jgi:hypothetical protein
LRTFSDEQNQFTDFKPLLNNYRKIFHFRIKHEIKLEGNVEDEKGEKID